MKRLLTAIRDLLQDGAGHWRFWWAGFAFLVGVLTWAHGLLQHDLSANLWTGIDFFWAVSYGQRFWRDTESQRRIRKWRRDREQ